MREETEAAMLAETTLSLALILKASEQEQGATVAAESEGAVADRGR